MLTSTSDGDKLAPYDCQLVAATSRRQLRSSGNFKCTLTSTRTRLGDRAFAAAGPWQPVKCLYSLHDTTGCQTGCTTGLHNRLYRV